MSTASIEPRYFGSADTTLFGCYYAPQATPMRDCGIVLCAPMGQEYIRSHRSYRLLALRLVSAGFPVLRFDFYGCGDSSGDFEQAQMRHWLQDIPTAIDAMRGRYGVTQICVVGLRLGGTLAMMAGAEQHDIDGMVLWDPIVNGQDYLEELIAWHETRLPYVAIRSKSLGKRPTPMEILGFLLGKPLLAELERLDLLAIQQPPAKTMLLIDSREVPGYGHLRAHLAGLGMVAEYRHLPSPPIWLEIANSGLVPHQLLQAVVAWLSEVFTYE